jgi:hypothetical protein
VTVVFVVVIAVCLIFSRSGNKNLNGRRMTHPTETRRRTEQEKKEIKMFRLKASKKQKKKV